MSVQHGENNYGYEIDEFSLDSNEYIVDGTARVGAMIDSLCFWTNTGRKYGPYGGRAGTKCPLSTYGKSGYLAHISGDTKIINTAGQKMLSNAQFTWMHNTRESHYRAGRAEIPRKFAASCKKVFIHYFSLIMKHVFVKFYFE